MSNYRNNKSRKLTTSRPVSSTYALGYDDARLGRPWPPSIILLSFDVPSQKNYERGRLLVTNLRALGLQVPPLTATGRLPKIVFEAFAKLVNSAPGTVWPGESHRLPDVPDLIFSRTPLNKRGFPLPVATYC